MSRKINVKYNEKGEPYFDIKDFEGLIDTSKIAFYQFVKHKNGQFELLFFDENKNRLEFDAEVVDGSSK